MSELLRRTAVLTAILDLADFIERWFSVSYCGAAMALPEGI
ncbi:hypothetical protein BJ987_002221 [Nocardia goodfellowii]|uniref:Uncharacterized protein n=1 Tax=Nocardia goodfellowii TaxID=882446 RepID=A0ABS4QDT1_9NOCA|nr:hypothetical protein [Nocardia goodfellowii]